MLNIVKRIVHAIMPKRCIESAEWVRGSLQCSCGAILALRYRMNHKLHTYIYPEFRSYRNEIMAKHYAIKSGDGVIGECCFDDFSTFMREGWRMMDSVTSSEETMEQNFKEDISLGESISEG